MRHSGNYATMIQQTYLLNGVEIKLYVHDELDRFVTKAGILFSTADLRHILDGIELHRRKEAEKEQQPLPPWQ